MRLCVRAADEKQDHGPGSGLLGDAAKSESTRGKGRGREGKGGAGREPRTLRTGKGGSETKETK